MTAEGSQGGTIPSKPTAKKAPHGEKMIEVRLRFWTDEIAEAKGYVVPKHAWSSGVARMQTNSAHGIRGGDEVVFNSLMEIPAAVEKVFLAQGIKLHASSRMRRYLTD